MRFFLIALFFLLAWQSGCSSTKASLREHKGTYLESVKLNFEAGEEALKKEDFDKALAYFQFVRSKYPFSKYAALSDLRIADAKYMQKKWLDAASAYEVFIRLHPRHEELAYASYRLGESYFYALPSKFFLFPEPASRDQTYAKEASAALERFVLEFPTSEYVKDAREKLLVLYENLARHNLLVADYYRRRGRFDAAIARYLSVDDLYPDTKSAIEALYFAAMIAKNNLKDEERATQILNRLIEEKPDSEQAKKAQQILEKLQEKENAQ